MQRIAAEERRSSTAGREAASAALAALRPPRRSESAHAETTQRRRQHNDGACRRRVSARMPTGSAESHRPLLCSGSTAHRAQRSPHRLSPAESSREPRRAHRRGVGHSAAHRAGTEQKRAWPSHSVDCAFALAATSERSSGEDHWTPNMVQAAARNAVSGGMDYSTIRGQVISLFSLLLPTHLHLHEQNTAHATTCDHRIDIATGAEYRRESIGMRFRCS